MHPVTSHGTRYVLQMFPHIREQSLIRVTQRDETSISAAVCLAHHTAGGGRLRRFPLFVRQSPVVVELVNVQVVFADDRGQLDESERLLPLVRPRQQVFVVVVQHEDTSGDGCCRYPHQEQRDDGWRRDQNDGQRIDILACVFAILSARTTINAHKTAGTVQCTSIRER